jgi:hypothetical protein
MGDYSSYINLGFFNIIIPIYFTKVLKDFRIDGCVALRRHPRVALLPKPFKNMRSMLLAFFIRPCLQERALDA